MNKFQVNDTKIIEETISCIICQEYNNEELAIPIYIEE